MPRIKTNRSKKPPKGFDDIEDTLTEFQLRLKDAESKPVIQGQSQKQSLHEIFQIHHQQSRYVYDLYYKKKAISSDLYQWLLKNRYADGNLIAKWRKQGYENLCCLQCIQTDQTIHGSTCVCRVPKSTLKGDLSAKPVQCITCGCRGCASTD